MKFDITITTGTDETTFLIHDRGIPSGGVVATTTEEALKKATRFYLSAGEDASALTAHPTGAHLGFLLEDEARWVAEWMLKHQAIFAPYEGELTGAVKRLIDAYLYSQGRECDPECTFWGLDEEDTIVISPTGEIAIYSPPGQLYRERVDLHDYSTGEIIRPATAEEEAASIKAAESDGGSGVITVNGRSCYVV